MFTKLAGKELIRVLALLKPRHLQYFGCILMMTGLTSLLTVGESYAIKWISNAIIRKDLPALRAGLISFSAFVLGVMVFFPVFTWFYNKSAKLTGAKTRLLFYEKLIRLPVAYFDQCHTGDIVSRMNNDTFAMENIYGSRLRRLISPLISSVIIAGAMLWMHWRMALILIGLNLIYVFLNSGYAVPIRRLSEKILAGMSAVTRKSLDVIAGYGTMKMFNLDRMMLTDYAAVNRDLTGHLVERLKTEGRLESANYLLSMINSVGVMAIGFLAAMRFQMDVGSLLALINIQSSLNRSLLGLSKYIPVLQESLVGARRVFEFLDEPPEADGSAIVRLPETLASIELKNVSFGYRGTEPVFEGLNLTVQAGEIVAFIGPSGSGKSTILKLLLSFYHPQSGEILINGRPLNHYSLRDARQLMAYVPQESHLFQGTIEENIRYGKPGATEDEIVAAAKAAYAHEFILTLPDGYRTDVSERGSALSGGQKQRIAIARAILKDAPLLLLDEATSALDSRSEQLVQQALERLMKDRTTIIVAHRLSTIRHAHRVYRMEGGRLTECRSESF